jgi:tripartite-type tricarboxylate transporter receptor subunit TctC
MAVLRRRAMLAATVGTTLAVPGIVNAQADWPKGPIKFIVPFPPGGGTDPIARIIAAKLIDTTGWQIVVENKPGAAGVVGATVAAKSPPDGQTWMVTFDSHILSPGFNALPYKDSDLLNVMLIGRAPLAIVCHPDRPYNNFAEAVADARKRPGKLSIGMLSASQSLLLMTYIGKENGFDANFIFYKGGGPIAQDALAGVTDVAINTLVSVTPYFRSGKLRPLATTGEKRPAVLPDTPTLIEQGIKAYPTYSWWGLYAPAGTPRPIVDRMNAEVAKAVRSADVTQKFVDQIHLEILASSPEEFASFQKVEQERWFKIIKDNGIKGD